MYIESLQERIYNCIYDSYVIVSRNALEQIFCKVKVNDSVSVQSSLGGCAARDQTFCFEFIDNKVSLIFLRCSAVNFDDIFRESSIVVGVDK